MVLNHSKLSLMSIWLQSANQGFSPFYPLQWWHHRVIIDIHCLVSYHPSHFNVTIYGHADKIALAEQLELIAFEEHQDANLLLEGKHLRCILFTKG